MRISDCSSDVCSSDRAALAARALGNENARTIDAGGMELDELHVLQRKARAQHHAAAVAGAGMGGRRRKIGTARTAGRKDHGVRAEAVDSAVFHAERDHALALAIDRKSTRLNSIH